MGIDCIAMAPSKMPVPGVGLAPVGRALVVVTQTQEASQQFRIAPVGLLALAAGYLRSLTILLAAHKAVLQEYLLAFKHCTNHVARLDAAQVLQWAMYPFAQALMTLRGFQLSAATVLVADGARSAKMPSLRAAEQSRAQRAGETLPNKWPALSGPCSGQGTESRPFMTRSGMDERTRHHERHAGGNDPHVLPISSEPRRSAASDWEMDIIESLDVAPG